MKKPPRKGEGKGKRKEGDQNITQPRSPPSTLRLLLSHWWGKVVALIVALAGLIGASWGTYQIVDGIRTIWFQTFPEIHVVGSDSTNPFVLPFSVRNASNWFDLKQVKRTCVIVSLRAKSGFSMNDVSTGPLNPGPDIKVGKTDNYRCLLNIPGEGMSAKVRAEVSYKLLWFDRPPETVEFNWIAGRWVEGELH
jgi:hypothetical protein